MACFTCFFHTDNHDLPASTRDWGRVVIVAATSGFDDNRRTGAVNLDIFIGIGSGFARVWFSQASLKKASCKYKKYMNIRYPGVPQKETSQWSPSTAWTYESYTKSLSC